MCSSITIYSPAKLWWTVPLHYPCSSLRYSRDPGGKKEQTISPPSSSNVTAKHKAVLLGLMVNSANCLVQKVKILTKSVWSWAAWLVNSLGDCWHSWHTCEIWWWWREFGVSGQISHESNCLWMKRLHIRSYWLRLISYKVFKKDHQHTSCNAVALWPVTSLHMIICSSRMTWKVDRIGLQSNTNR